MKPNRQIDPELICLLANHECHEILWDCYGDIGEDGTVEVTDVAPAGMKLSMGVMFTRAQLDSMTDAAQRVRDAQVREVNDQARIDRFEEAERRVRIARKAENPREVFA